MANVIKPEASGEPNVETSEDLSKLTASEESSSKDATSETDESQSKLEDSSSEHVSFGSVHVHKHCMTLGSNPSATGIPVELAWDQHESEELAVDEFEARQVDEHKDVQVIPLKKRMDIAQARHSWECIARVEEELHNIQESRVDSAFDDDSVQDDDPAQDDDRRRKRLHSHKKKLLPWNWFSR